MSKSLLAWTLAGSVIGALLASSTGYERDLGAPIERAPAAGRDAATEGRAPGDADTAPSVRDGAGVFTDRLALYAAASASYDPNLLAAQIEAALERPLSPSTMVQVEAMLGRLFELEPEAAVSILRARKLPAPLMSSVFRLWAEIDSAAAIGLLAELDAVPQKRLLAVAIIEIVGSEAIDAIVAADPALGAEGLATAALIRRAERDLSRALGDIAELPSFAQRVAIAEISRIAAGSDAAAAIAATAAIDDITLKPIYLEALHTQLSLGGLPRYFAFLQTLNPNAEQPSRALRSAGFSPPTTYARALANAAAGDAARLLELGRELGGELGLAAETEALEVLSAQDPVNALEYLASLPSGVRRDKLAVSIAAGYARHDLDAALGWVTQLQPPKARVRNAVLGVLAETDLARAVRIDLDDPITTSGRRVDAPNLPAWFGDGMNTVLNDPAGVANDLAERAPGRWWKEVRLTAVLSQWAIDDPNAAIAWMQTHGSDVPVRAVEAVADIVTPQAARVGADWLIAFGDMLDPQRRPEWLRTVIEKAAAVDPAVAMAVADRYRSERFYDSLLTTVVRAAVWRMEPIDAARLLGPSHPPMALMAIAREWVDVDPVTASNWATDLPNQEARSTAVGSVAQRWAETDVAAATRWAHGLGDRGLRTEALERICRHSPGSDACE